MGSLAGELLNGGHDSGGTNKSTVEELRVVDWLSGWLWCLLGSVGAEGSGVAGKGTGESWGGETGKHRDGDGLRGQFMVEESWWVLAGSR